MLKRRIAEVRFTVRGHTMSLNTKATRRLGVYLNSGLQVRTHKNPTLEKARREEDGVGRLAATRVLAPGLVGQIQVAVVQAVVLYGAEICWNCQKGWCEEYQKLLNRQCRAITGMIRSAPVVVVTRETVLRPALSLLNNKQRRYGLRLLAEPVIQHARNILPASLREGNEQAQSGEQLENYNV